MEVSSQKVSRIFSGGGEVHYVLPHFQREYAWNKKNWITLLDDIFSIYQIYNPDAEPPEHFMGALVVINDGTRNGTIPAFKLVDGQQRLTSLSLILSALAYLVENSQPSLYRKIKKLLINEDEDGIVRYKIVPTSKYNNRDTYISILEGGGLGEEGGRVHEAFQFFYQQLKLRISENVNPEYLYFVIVNCLHFVFIQLSQNERPYEIFESLNAKGKELTQADLVRNYIAMRLPEQHQEKVFESYWAKIENLLHESRLIGRGNNGELTAFLRHYLTMRGGVLINFEHVYERFRDRMESEFKTSEAFIQEIIQLTRFATNYSMFLRPQEAKYEPIEQQLSNLNVLEASTFYPFLLVMFDKHHQEIITTQELMDGLALIENYLMRRYLANEPTNYLNKVTPVLEREVNWSKFIESLTKALLRKNYPTDRAIRESIISRRLYQRNQILTLLLERINRHLSQGSDGHTVLADKATVEHIMPQTLNADWRQHLGEECEEIHREYIHTLGNLTLVTSDWNSSLSNSSFDTKKQRLMHHALRLNSEYFSKEVTRWDDNAIRERTNFLVDKTLEIWTATGEPLVTPNLTGRTPRQFCFLGEFIEVNSWRDIAQQMAEGVIRLVPANEFEKVAYENNYFSREERSRSTLLSNGWWLYISLSANAVWSLCERLATAVGLSTPDDWYIETLEGNEVQ
jgi:uncharacterized protein with ParB-like and HNH nuclease domain